MIRNHKAKFFHSIEGMLIWLAVVACTSPQDDKGYTSGFSEKPNVIYVMSDDHTTQAIGAYGGRLAGLNPTPTIDRLAKEGMLFTRVFCNNSICTPSRASIMTGQYPQTNGVLDLSGHLDPENQYLAKEMNRLGYQTAMIGKWHLKKEPAAFDYYSVLPDQGDYFNPTFRIQGKNEWPDNAVQHEGHSTDVITNLTIDWLKNRDKDTPFFLMHHYKAPHDMFEFAPRYKNYLEDTEIPEPSSLYYDRNHGSVATRGKNDSLIHDIGSSISHRNPIRNMGMHMDIDSLIPDPTYASMAYQAYLKRYLRCVKGIDDNLKRLFDFLESSGIMDNTIIIYTADQGFMLGEHDYIDKRWMYEESMRMPFIVRFPKTVKAGSVSETLINNTDFAPTMIELAGGQVPDYMQGRSFKSILLTGEEPNDWRQAVYYRYWMHMAHKHANPAHFGIRTPTMKLIFFYGIYYQEGNRNAWGNRYDFETPAGWEFYDLKKDPYEMDNRYDDPLYQDTIRVMKQQLKQIRKQLNETDDDYPSIQIVIDDHWDD